MLEAGIAVVWIEAEVSNFDPDYAVQPLEVFEPVIRRIFGRQPHDPRYVAPA